MAKRSRLLLRVVSVIDVIAAPFTMVAAAWLKSLRVLGLQYAPVSKRILLRIGVFPVRDHYYEPMINPKHLRHPLSDRRPLPAVDLNVEEQLSLLAQFTFQKELLAFPADKTDRLEFYYRNASFMSGDAEYFYSFIRLLKPRRIVEIGCGFSTLMARNAIVKNQAEDSSYSCEHVCIEPYEQPWLEELGVTLIRDRVEKCDPAVFASLQKGDILFIDSSHVIRPQGDVLFEYLELLPQLKSGVYVHIHDIFTPQDYLKEWVCDENKMWNEQYLLEAFLCFNREFRVIGALNYLKTYHGVAVGDRLPVLNSEMEKREPGSFWLVRQ
jgi:hypothetical protein